MAAYKLFVWTCVLLSVLEAKSQNKLADSKTFSEDIFVYQLNTDDLKAIYKKQEKIGEKFLHTYITHYHNKAGTPALPRGNYLLVQAKGNQLEYNSYTVDHLHYHFPDGENFYLYLSDDQGRTIKDAHVRLNQKKLKFNSQTSTYTARDFRKAKTLEIENHGVFHYIQLQPNPQTIYKPVPIKKYWWKMKSLFRNHYREKDYASFIVFNKPKYKPGETVRFKAYIASRDGNLCSKKVQVRLLIYGQTDTILTTLTPYRPGMYQYTFPLTDDLKIKSDRSYRIDLLPENSRRIYASNYFQVEEYEQQRIKLEVSSSTTHHQKQNPPILSLKVTDENDMAVTEGSCTITVIASSLCTLLDSIGFVPHQLWNHQISLAHPGAQEIVLPDSIFPSNVSFSYIVSCLYQSADQERQIQSIRLYYDASPSRLQFTTASTGILISQFTNGRADTTDAIICQYSIAGDSIACDSVRLPFTLRISPNVSYYNIKTSKTQKICNPEEYLTSLIIPDFHRSRDSLWLNVQNPCNYPFWYTIRKGAATLKKGYDTTLNFSKKIHSDDNFSMQIEYLVGGKLKTLSNELMTRDKQIQIQLNTPSVVYPGQKTKVEIGLTDYKGRPIANADVTAYAITSKLDDHTPFIPYWGKNKTAKIKTFQPQKTPQEIRKIESLLTWNRWKQEMGLDSIEYYHFLYPDPLYRSTESCPITQIAPYLTIKGELQPVYVIKIDNQPYYYYGTEHLPVYSFPVLPGKHSIRLRTNDSEILLDDIYIQAGTKTILSADIEESHPESNIFVNKTNKENIGRLSPTEQLLLNKYLFSVTRNFASRKLVRSSLRQEKPAYLKSGNLLYYLNPSHPTPRSRESYISNRSILTGPFPDLDTTTLYIGHQPVNQFVPECGYEYTIRQGYLKLKQSASLQPPRELRHFTPQPDFKAHVLTSEDIDKMQENYLKEYLRNSRLKFTDFNAPIQSEMLLPDYYLQLDIGNPDSRHSPYLILFFNENKTIRDIYSGASRTFPRLRADKLQMVLLFPDDSYYQCPVNLKPYGINYLSIDSLPAQKGDHFSQWIANFLKTKLLYEWDNTFPDNASSDTQTETIQEEPTNLISGTVFSAFDGSPMPGATVRVKGTTFGTATDMQGHFRMKVPSTGTVSFDFIGCKSQEMPLMSGCTYQIFLENDHAILDEIVVTGAVTKRKRSFTGAMILNSKSSGNIQIRETKELLASEKRNLPPMIILNGLPYSGSLESIDENLIISLKRIASPKAVDLYGIQGQNGVIIIRTAVATDQQQPGHSLRHNFRDDAFWQPALETDQTGKTSFEVTYPDDITNWQAHFIAIDNRQNTGYATTSIKSFKAITARLSLPGFALLGDHFNAIGKLNNYLDDTLTVKQTTIVDGKSQEKQIIFTNSNIDTIPIHIASTDSLKVTFSLEKEDGFFDGEERTIPVYRAGSSEHCGIFNILNTDSTENFRLNPESGKITVHAETTANNIILREIKEIEIYPYLCNEQMASKLKALIAKKKICKLLNLPFKEKKKIENLITRITQNQNSQGLWGWWNREASVTWISLHVTEALLAAEAEDFKVTFDRQLAIEYLQSQLVTAYTNRETSPFSKSNYLNSLAILKALKAQIDYKRYINDARQIPNFNLFERLLSLRVQQLAGIPVNKSEVMLHSHYTMMGNLYWEIQKPGSYPNPLIPEQNIVQNTLLAYQILRSLGDSSNELEKIRNYFFEIRRNGYWQNTYESSRIIETIFPDIVTPETPFATAQLTLNSKTIKTFPFTAEYAANTLLQVRKTGTLPVFFTAWQTNWNPHPEAESKGFQVKTFFRQNKDTVVNLKSGEIAELTAVVTAESDAEYVMIEIPIPAGCSYESKNNYQWNDTHQEYFKDKVAIFVPKLKRGKHTFTVELIPRFTGKYHLNPAHAGLMYFPTFYGRESMKMTEIR